MDNSRLAPFPYLDKFKEHLKIDKEEINRLINSGWLIEKEGGYQLVKVFTEG